MTVEQKWPQTVWIVRHGQSAGNVARDAAEASKLLQVDIETRDMDTPLSALGKEQAAVLGQWFHGLPVAQQPTVVLCSPYIRALQTAQAVLELQGVEPKARIALADERLREKEFGILDRLTVFGIKEKYPDLAEQRQHVGKFYFRPPGGESWCDVILRLRNVIDTIAREYRRERVLIIGHQVIVNCLRYLFERMDEQQILEIDRLKDVPNCSITSYEYDPGAGKNGQLVLQLVNFVARLEEAGTPVTAAPDLPAGPKS